MVDNIRKQFREWVGRLPEGRAKRLYQWLSFKVAVAFALFSLAVIIFAKLANEVREQDTLGIDRWGLLQIHSHFSSWLLDTIIPATTDIGGTAGIIILTTLFSGVCFFRRKFDRALFVLVATGGAVVLNLILKSLFARLRPELWDRLIIENGFSFPSGHAMASGALALSLVVVLWYTRWRVPALIGGMVYVAYVGFTRLYLGVHYPTDIVGAWLISFAWVVLAWLLFRQSKQITG